MGATAVAEQQRASPGWRAMGLATLFLTWALMVMGALTRASQAGVSCPDWPLCHGYLVPPLSQGAYPADPLYAVHKVYLEFVHRVLAALVSVGAVAVAWRTWKAGRRGLTLTVLGTLALQVAMGAATVWLRNAPYTVVVHLALALGFLAALAAAHRQVLAPSLRTRARALGTGTAAVLALLVAQMLVGAAVSSGYFALACSQFPLCEDGALLPADWTEGLVWQMAHRGLGALVLVAALGMAARAWRAGHDRVLWLSVSAGILVQALLGGLNVWLRVPPWASAAHLGLAAILFATLVLRLARRAGSQALPQRAPSLDRAA
ncbi:MAG TPA: COX15/CtaA family protein [Myxococcales bacterium]|jgi:cytochrome c oxidase assembly protein subunit 15